jgi:uncharacterized protein YoxC
LLDLTLKCVMEEQTPKPARRRRPRKLERRSGFDTPTVQSIAEETSIGESADQQPPEGAKVSGGVELSSEELKPLADNEAVPDSEPLIETVELISLPNPINIEVLEDVPLSTASSRTPSARRRRRRRPRKLVVRNASAIEDADSAEISVELPTTENITSTTTETTTSTNDFILQRVSILEERVQQMNHQLESTVVDVREMKSSWSTSRAETTVTETSTNTETTQQSTPGKGNNRNASRTASLPTQTVTHTGILSEPTTDESETDSDIETIILPPIPTPSPLPPRSLAVRSQTTSSAIQPSRPLVREFSAAFRSSTTVRTATEVRTSSSSGAMRMRQGSSETFSQAAGSALGGMFMAQASRVIEGAFGAANNSNERPTGSARRTSSRRGRPYDVSDL